MLFKNILGRCGNVRGKVSLVENMFSERPSSRTDGIKDTLGLSPYPAPQLKCWRKQALTHCWVANVTCGVSSFCLSQWGRTNTYTTNTSTTNNNKHFKYIIDYNIPSHVPPIYNCKFGSGPLLFASRRSGDRLAQCVHGIS
jgi:hypothetical protein